MQQECTNEKVWCSTIALARIIEFADSVWLFQVLDVCNNMLQMDMNGYRIFDVVDSDNMQKMVKELGSSNTCYCCTTKSFRTQIQREYLKNIYVYSKQEILKTVGYIVEELEIRKQENARGGGVKGGRRR